MSIRVPSPKPPLNTPTKREIAFWVGIPIGIVLLLLGSLATGKPFSFSLVKEVGSASGAFLSVSGKGAAFISSGLSFTSQPPSTPQPEDTASPSPLLQDSDGRTYILFAGIPGQGNVSPYLTDTVMLVSLNPAKQAVSMVSLPRDLWVKVPGANFYGRLNGIYQYGRKTSDARGMELLKEAVTEVTGITPHYYARIDLAGIKEVIDIVGGVTVEVKENIRDRSFPGPGRSYELFTLEPGVQELDGTTALKYIRTRHSGRGDFDRVLRQQDILRAIKEKITALHPLSDFHELYALFESVNAHTVTNISLRDGKTLWDAAKGIRNANIYSHTLSTDLDTGLLRYGKIDFGAGGVASVVWPKKGQFDYHDIRAAIADIVYNPRPYSL